MSPLRRLDPELVRAAFELYSIQCADGEHELCGGSGACSEQLALHVDSCLDERRARAFDASRAALERRQEQPSPSWATSALLRTVLDLILTPPTSNWLWRSISITTALARLGERGLSPDAVMRTGFGEDLTRRILLDAASFWVVERDTGKSRANMPPLLRGWAALIDADQALASGEFALDWFRQVVQTSGVAGQARTWLRTAAVGNLVGWQVEGFLEVNRGPEEMVFPGGKDATRWVCDRLARTYLSDWHASSLHWELAYIRAPMEIAVGAGVDPDILSERICTEGMVTEELCHRVRAPGVRDSIGTELLAQDLIASLGLLLHEGRCDVARAQARRAFEAYPNKVEFRVAYAFCTIPENPAEARRLLEPLLVDESAPGGLVRANLATCALFDGDPARALNQAAEVLAPAGDQPVWLWDPAAAQRGHAEVHLEPLEEWVGRLRAEVQST